MSIAEIPWSAVGWTALGLCAAFAVVFLAALILSMWHSNVEEGNDNRSERA